MNVDQRMMNSRRDLKRTRSAHAPIINAGVIAANLSWKAKISSVGIVSDSVSVIVSMVMPFRPNIDKLPMTPPMLGPKARL